MPAYAVAAVTTSWPTKTPAKALASAGQSESRASTSSVQEHRTDGRGADQTVVADDTEGHERIASLAFPAATGFRRPAAPRLRAHTIAPLVLVSKSSHHM